jgi:acid phosphatase class B
MNHLPPGAKARDTLTDLNLAPDARIMSFDLDGTVASIQRRLDLAPGKPDKNGEIRRSFQDWDVVLNGANYHLDSPIPGARRYVNSLTQQGYAIVYLSGRREGTEGYTARWLLEHGFPRGAAIIHRPKGTNSKSFKQHVLVALKQHGTVAAHFGDRPGDDCVSAVRAGVRPVCVVRIRTRVFELDPHPYFWAVSHHTVL